ncbi:hypothetical protein OIDMADRAFT_17806 [Oidiodendron maius Zn]|uniref:Uncharacterized protein n=1 Tax=Oidiodendron maius (strain Zn) TaxID=913774 RepID=A0A0C3DSF5_OIDMZ|nr:hypothetical protein OIDMADRAFT_17806 [Oidiodendron maius Zn]
MEHGGCCNVAFLRSYGRPEIREIGAELLPHQLARIFDLPLARLVAFVALWRSLGDRDGTLLHQNLFRHRS